MLPTVESCSLIGIDAELVEVECGCSQHSIVDLTADLAPQVA